MGNLISMSVIQGGPGPRCFAPWIYDYLSLGVDGVNPEVSDMPHDVQTLLEEVRVILVPNCFCLWYGCLHSGNLLYRFARMKSPF